MQWLGLRAVPGATQSDKRQHSPRPEETGRGAQYLVGALLTADLAAPGRDLSDANLRNPSTRALTAERSPVTQAPQLSRSWPAKRTRPQALESQRLVLGGLANSPRSALNPD